jgi:hypothetical protein
VVELFVAQTPDRARVNRPAQIDLKPSSSRTTKELIEAIVEFKRRNPRVGCPRIAQEIAHAFGIDIDKDIVRRVLAKHYRPEAGTDGPLEVEEIKSIPSQRGQSWLTDQ